MERLIMVRHAKAKANERDFAAFNNEESPLIEGEKGIPRAKALRGVLYERFGIDTVSYDRAVGSSELTRARQTLEYAGFRCIEATALLNEAAFDRGGLSPEAVVLKHIRERWVPADTAEQAAELLDQVRRGAFPYEICGSHGMLIASVKLQLVDEALAADREVPFEFGHHGYIPDFAELTVAQTVL